MTAVLVIKNVRGAILIGIIATTVAGIPAGVVDLSTIDFANNNTGTAFAELGTTFLAALMVYLRSLLTQAVYHLF